MKPMKQLKGWLLASCLTLVMLAFAGCGGGSSSTTAVTTPVATKTTALGAISATAGNSGAADLTVAAPTGVTLSIPANTVLTDATANPVSGSITTSVSYSTTAADLPSAATTLPAGATLVAFADVSLSGASAQVKNFSKAVTLGFKVPTGAAAAGDSLAIYSFDSASGQWSFARVEKVDANGNIAPGITHLSVWGVFKSSVTPPAKPATFSVGAGDGQATLTWITASDAAYYNIYYSTTTGVTAANGIRVDHAASGQIITGLTNGTSYSFVVVGVNAGGEGVLSVERTVIPAALPLPANTAGVVLTSPAPGQAGVTWTVPVTNAASFNVYYLLAAAQPTQAQVLNGGTVQNSVTSPALITGLTSGATYYVLVRAVNATGVGGTQNTPKPIVIN